MRRQWCSLGSRGPAHTSSPLSASPNHEHTGLSQVCIPDDKKHSPQKQRLRVPGSDNHEGQLAQARAPPWASASAHPFSLHTPGSSHRSSPSRPPGAFVCPPACPPPSLSQLGMFCLTHLRSIHPSGPRAHCSVPGDRGQPPSPAVSPGTQPASSHDLHSYLLVLHPLGCGPVLPTPGVLQASARPC